MNNTGNSKTLNLTLIISIALLVSLIIYGNKFRDSSTEAEVSAQAAPKSSVVPARTPAQPRYVPKAPSRNSAYTLAPQAASPLDGVKHPVATPAVIKTIQHTTDTTEALHTLVEKQSRDLSRETAAQGMRPEDKRALALTPDSIRKLKASGNLIY